MPIDPGSDSRNRLRAHTSEESSELGSYELVTIECDIAKDTFDAALASADDALVLVQWLESKRTD
jgi:hypothetical protein